MVELIHGFRCEANAAELTALDVIGYNLMPAGMAADGLVSKPASVSLVPLGGLIEFAHLAQPG